MKATPFPAVLLAIGALSACGCASPVPPARAPVAAADAAQGERARERALDEDEKSALDFVASADPRFARRLANPPKEALLQAAAVQALAEGDPDVSVRDGALDFFAFTARARSLAQAAKTLGRSPEPPGASPPWLERELTRRLIAEEAARLDEERSLPRGASALVRGIVETWSTPSSAEGMKERDQWLARKLDLIRGALAGSALSRSALIALDGALDPLERIAPPEELPSSAGALARLRVSLDVPAALGGTATRDGGATRAALVEAGVRAHLGLDLDAAETRKRLTRAESALRAMAREATAHGDERAIAKRAEELTFAEARCEGSPSASRVRSMAPPPERAAVCGSLHALHDAGDDATLAAALVALHDETVVALWSLALHLDALSADQAEATAHPFYGAEPEREARLVRFAESRPVTAIGAGLALDLLTRAGKASLAEARAATGPWLSFGDAPLDLVARELFSDVPPTPASPRP